MKNTDRFFSTAFMGVAFVAIGRYVVNQSMDALIIGCTCVLISGQSAILNCLRGKYA